MLVAPTRAIQATALRGYKGCLGASPALRLRTGGSRNFSQSRHWRSVATPTITRGDSKLYKSADEAVADIQSGSVILSSGFGLCGIACEFQNPSTPNARCADRHQATLITALRRRGPDSLHSLTAVSNNAGAEGRGGLALLTENGQVDRMIMSFLGANKTLERQYLTGKIAVELCPQGTLAERIRAAGSGIPAFFTPTGGS